LLVITYKIIHIYFKAWYKWQEIKVPLNLYDQIIDDHIIFTNIVSNKNKDFQFYIFGGIKSNHWNFQFFVVLKGSLIPFSVNSSIVINICLLVAIGWKWLLLKYCIHFFGALFTFQKNFYIPLYIWVLNFWNFISIEVFGVYFLSNRWIHGKSISA
jgi:hypothetical protein